MRCNECDQGLECCHGTSIAHADQRTECLGEGPCGLAHELHRWTASCDEAGCRCRLETAPPPLALPLAA